MTALLPLSSSVVSSLSGFLFMGFCSLQLRRSIGHIISPRKFKTVPCLFVTDYSYPNQKRAGLVSYVLNLPAVVRGELWLVLYPCSRFGVKLRHVMLFVA